MHEEREFNLFTSASKHCSNQKYCTYTKFIITFLHVCCTADTTQD